MPQLPPWGCATHTRVVTVIGPWPVPRAPAACAPPCPSQPAEGRGVGARGAAQAAPGSQRQPARGACMHTRGQGCPWEMGRARARHAAWRQQAVAITVARATRLRWRKAPCLVSLKYVQQPRSDHASKIANSHRMERLQAHQLSLTCKYSLSKSPIPGLAKALTRGYSVPYCSPVWP